MSAEVKTTVKADDNKPKVAVLSSNRNDSDVSFMLFPSTFSFPSLIIFAYHF